MRRVSVSHQAAVAAVVALLAVLHFSAGAAALAAKDLRGEELEALLKSNTTSSLLLFHRGECPFCVAIYPRFDTIATAFEGEEGVVVGRVNCGDPANEMYNKRFQMNFIPVIIFFPAGHGGATRGHEYPRRTDRANVAERVMEWLNPIAGTQRELGGLAINAGTDTELDTLAARLTAAAAVREDGGGRGARAAELDEIIGAMQRRVAAIAAAERGKPASCANRTAPIYVEIANSVVRHGAQQPKQEALRLRRLLRSKLSAVQQDEATLRLNVVERFVQRSLTEILLEDAAVLTTLCLMAIGGVWRLLG